MKSYAMGLAVGVALVALAACGGGDSGGSGGSTGGGGATPAGGGGGEKAAYDAAAHTASFSGTVVFKGEKPKAVPLAMTSDAFCTDQWKGKTPTDQQFDMNDDGSVPNAFVWAAKGPHKDLTGYTPPAGFVVTQAACFYVPHVFGVMEGQTFTVKNADTTTHNVRVRAKRNDGFNIAQSAGASDTVTFNRKEQRIPFTCDVHSWMAAWAYCLEHPFFATTGADGKFEIQGLPAGKYEFRAWHEHFGEKKLEVEIGAGEAKSQDVEVEK